MLRVTTSPGFMASITKAQVVSTIGWTAIVASAAYRSLLTRRQWTRPSSARGGSSAARITSRLRGSSATQMTVTKTRVRNQLLALERSARSPRPPLWRRVNSLSKKMSRWKRPWLSYKSATNRRSSCKCPRPFKSSIMRVRIACPWEKGSELAMWGRRRTITCSMTWLEVRIRLC